MKKIIIVLVLTILFSCKENGSARKPIKQVTVEQNWTEMQKKLSKYVTFKLTSDINVLTENERKMLPILIKAASIMNELFWYEAYGNKNQLLDSISNEDTKKFVEINYGPWDRLDGNIPFIEGVGNKPAGANYYPTDMTKLEFDAFADEKNNHSARLNHIIFV